MGDPLVHRGTGAGGHPLTMRDTAHPLKTVLKPMLRRRGGPKTSALVHTHCSVPGRTSISPEASNATLCLFTATGQSCENEMRNASSVRLSRSERASHSSRRCCDYGMATGGLESAGGRGLARVCEHFLRPPAYEGTMAKHRSFRVW